MSAWHVNIFWVLRPRLFMALDPTSDGGPTPISSPQDPLLFPDVEAVLTGKHPQTEHDAQCHFIPHQKELR